MNGSQVEKWFQNFCGELAGNSDRISCLYRHVPPASTALSGRIDPCTTAHLQSRGRDEDVSRMSKTAAERSKRIGEDAARPEEVHPFQERKMIVDRHVNGTCISVPARTADQLARLP